MDIQVGNSYKNLAIFNQNHGLLLYLLKSPGHSYLFNAE